ncbi:ceramide glucosyltransferase [Vulgatibacter incomptus]|uniref:Ceramide glucosyltransferase n=1 Tax=Vulgatibacter incomptus TaxID=1391653 RepID=A0A0K1PER5_9BACT|nr:ceramide glucosyltransferase [Vulgatibacter incomptus]AKU91992.1 Ceramide glucosyltransferase [Vulgatibacter incomptus]
MFDAISLTLFAAAATGLTILALQLVTLRLHLRRPPKRMTSARPISILKPLCGVDDDLENNLEHFATLDYPSYELLLGVRSPSDPAYPLALACASRHPERVRVIVQRGEPGLNPKVNQLITLEREARFGIVVVSDSNVRVRPGYLDEIAANLEDPTVGLVTHPIAGVGEQRLGSLLDNLHLVTHCAPGTISAKLLAGRDIVVGKSMAMRRIDVARLGGFASVKDVLAEDYVLGLAVGRKLRKSVSLGAPIENVSERRPLSHFVSRYHRWSVLQRKMVGLPAYLAQLLLNPIVLALLGLAAAPNTTSLLVFAGICATKIMIDATCGLLLRDGFRLLGLAAIPLKDVIVAWAWLVGLVRDTVEWRGNRLVVLEGTRLASSEGEVDFGDAQAEPEVA